MNKLTKKFRFDSFATEFSEENINDNDSGIGEFFNFLRGERSETTRIYIFSDFGHLFFLVQKS